MSALPPVLLANGQFYGTLAAARCLGRAGVPVALAEGHALAPARWSRFVSRRVACPPLDDGEAFLAWLLAFGAAEPGHVLLPTSDDVAWLVAENRAALALTFHVLPTSFEAVSALLDKRALLERCRDVGLDVPETWFPASEEEAVALGRAAGFPLLLKPRTQVLHRSLAKGLLVADPGELGRGFRDLVAYDRYGDRVRRRIPDVALPMLERYYPAAQGHIYGLSGYAGRGGEILAARAARKILQRPRRLGIGLCFEDAAVEPRLRDGIGALCRSVGYEGVFEVELIEVGERALVIDFNPRFYSQLGFDVDRGLPLPRLAYADALGDAAAVEALAAEARAWRSPGERVYCHRLLFEAMLLAHRAGGGGGAAESRRWRRWWEEHRSRASDATLDAGDPLPTGVDAAAHLVGLVRHPRSFLRALALDQDPGSLHGERPAFEPS